MKYDYVNRFLSSTFKTLGLQIGKHPYYFIFIPLLTIMVFSTGLLTVTMTTDSEYLYCPINGRARTERKAVESLFPPNMSDFDVSKMTRFGRIGLLLIEPKDHGSMLRKQIFEEIRSLDKIIKNISINYNGKTMHYNDLCAKTKTGECVENYFISLANEVKAKNIEPKRLHIRFPYDLNEASLFLRLPASNLGGVTTDENRYIKDVKAARIFYLLDYITKGKNKASLKWEEAFLQTISNINTNYTNLYKFVGSTFDTEFHQVTQQILPFLHIVIPIMVTFAVLTCLTTDWVTTKPWMGVAGCICPAISCAAAFGFLLFCGARYVDVNITIPFLLLGIGLDDSFVVLAAWKRTNSGDSVENRLSKTYSEAAVSVTITSLTNFLSFCIGLTTPYNVIKIYSLYAATSILFAYISQITLFGGFLALSGRRENNNVHSLFCVRINSEKTFKWSLCHFLYFGISTQNSADSSGKDICLNFFKNKIGNLLTKPSVKSLISVLFVVYLSGGIYCLKFLNQGFDYRDGFPYASYAVNFTTKHYEYFVHYPHVVQVAINKTLDYSDPQVQRNITDILNRFSTAPNMGGEGLFDSWMHAYLLSMNNSRLWFSYRGYNFNKPEDFMHGLKTFLKFPSSHRYEQDIIFNENKTEIVATRFLVFSKDIIDSAMERELLPRLWGIADSYDFPIYVHNYWFLILNQHLNVKETSIQTLCIASALITFVFLLFIPNIICAACVAFTIASIQLGVIGYMSVWNVNLDTLSMLILIMAAGLSVDYAAHLSYAYVTSKQKNPNEKTKSALFAAGYPIFQGSVSTILGVAVFAFGPSYAFVIFFKVITLVMCFSFLHGIFFLPVFLNIWETFIEQIVFRRREPKNINNNIQEKERKRLMSNKDKSHNLT